MPLLLIHPWCLRFSTGDPKRLSAESLEMRWALHTAHPLVGLLANKILDLNENSSPVCQMSLTNKDSFEKDIRAIFKPNYLANNFGHPCVPPNCTYIVYVLSPNFSNVFRSKCLNSLSRVFSSCALVWRVSNSLFSFYQRIVWRSWQRRGLQMQNQVVCPRARFLVCPGICFNTLLYLDWLVLERFQVKSAKTTTEVHGRKYNAIGKTCRNHATHPTD